MNVKGQAVADRRVRLQRNFYGQAFAGPNGDWLNGPQAVIQGLVNGSFATVLLQLHA